MDTLRHAAALQSNPIAPLVVIGAHIVAGLVLVPVTFLITVSTMAFGPWLGITYWLFGCLGSAMLTFVLGRFLGHDTVLNTLLAAPVRVPLRRRTLADRECEPILSARRDTHGVFESPHATAAPWRQAHHLAVARGEARPSSAALVTGC